MILLIHISGAFSLAGLVAGLVVGAVVLAAAVIFAVLFVRWQRKRKQGLVVEVQEPDYELVAYQGDLSLQYKIEARDNYKYVIMFRIILLGGN